jgi:hypothetical protein
MTQRLRDACVLALAFAMAVGTAACGSSGSGGGAPGNGPTQGPGFGAAAEDYSSMLYGHFDGEWAADDHVIDVTFFEDGTCDWFVKNWMSFYDNEAESQHTGWTWSVSGADSMPSISAPWLLRLTPDADDPLQHYPMSRRIVAIDAAGFTVIVHVDKADEFKEMQRK